MSVLRTGQRDFNAWRLPGISLLLCCCWFVVTAQAEPRGLAKAGSAAHTPPVNASKTYHAAPLLSKALESSTQDTETLATLAAPWKLTAAEFRRYHTLMQGPLGRWNPHMDPVLALGIFAESVMEQQRFAERYAQQEYALTTRTLAFERVYRQAFARLFPNAEIINPALLQPYYAHQQARQQAQQQAHQQAIAPDLRAPNSASEFFRTAQSLQAGDRLLYFPRHDCRDCGARMADLQQRLSPLGLVLDVYVRQATTDAAVRAWAESNEVAVEWLSTGRLTLNQDQGLYQRLQAKIPAETASARASLSPSSPSLLFLRRGDHIYRLREAAWP